MRKKMGHTAVASTVIEINRLESILHKQRSNIYRISRYMYTDSRFHFINRANHYDNLSMQYTEIFTRRKMKIHSKNVDIFDRFAQNIDCGYPQSMFWIKNKKKK